MLIIWMLFVWWSGVTITAQDNSSACIIGSIPNYTVWLESPLRVGFNSSRNCSYYLLFRRDIKIDLQFNAPGDNNNTYFVTFTIPSVSIEFNNVKMTVKAEDSHRRQIYQRFFIYTRDTAGQVENISNTTNCSHTVVCWEHPQPKELPIKYYSYKLTSNDTLVHSDVIIDLCVAFDLTLMKPNMLGFNFTIEAHAQSWNGTKVSIQLIAATAPSAKYYMNYDVAMVHTDGSQERAVLLLKGMIDHQLCPTADPTVVFLHFTCGHNPPAVQPIPVHIASSSITEVIQSDPVEAGHRNCSVVIVSSNLSGETINESIIFNTTDVQVFTAYQNFGKIYFTFEVAINSSKQQFMVNVTSSAGKNVSIPVWRTSNQRQLTYTNKTKVLPIDLYSLSLFARESSHSTYVFTNITMSVNVTWSNYSSPTPISTPISTPLPSVAQISPTPVPIDYIILIIAVVTATDLVF